MEGSGEYPRKNVSKDSRNKNREGDVLNENGRREEILEKVARRIGRTHIRQFFALEGIRNEDDEKR